MIDVLTNGFLTNPIPLNLNLNYCSHNCAYCFANLNSPKRKADLSSILSSLRNYKTRNDLVSYYLREKYHVIISNNIDPFSRSNYSLFESIGNFFLQEEIPMQISTRGGNGWKEFSAKMNKSLWYVSVPYDDESLRQRLEPNAPTLSDRFEMVKDLVKKHNVIIALNPLNEQWTPEPIEIIKKYQSIGVTNFWINAIHLSAKQQTNLTENQKELIGKDLLNRLKSGKEYAYTDEYIDLLIEIKEYCKSENLVLHGLEDGFKNNTLDVYKECYPKLLPTIQDFYNSLSVEKEITFNDFYNFFKTLIPDIETNISKFIFNKSVIDDKSSYKKTKLSNLLHYYWQIKGVELGMAKYTGCFSWVKKDYGNKVDFKYDENHNKILKYHPQKENWNDYIIE